MRSCLFIGKARYAALTLGMFAVGTGSAGATTIFSSGYTFPETITNSLSGGYMVADFGGGLMQGKVWSIPSTGGPPTLVFSPIDEVYSGAFLPSSFGPYFGDFATFGTDSVSGTVDVGNNQVARLLGSTTYLDQNVPDPLYPGSFLITTEQSNGAGLYRLSVPSQTTGPTFTAVAPYTIFSASYDFSGLVIDSNDGNDNGEVALATDGTSGYIVYLGIGGPNGPGGTLGFAIRYADIPLFAGETGLRQIVMAPPGFIPGHPESDILVSVTGSGPNGAFGEVLALEDSDGGINGSVIASLNQATLPGSLSPRGLDFTSTGQLLIANTYGTIDEATSADFVLGRSIPSAVPEPGTIFWDNSAGTGNGQTWDTSSENWMNGSTPAIYADGANVTFNNTNNGHYAVTLNSTVSPASVTFSNSSGSYMLSGSGGIAGLCELTVNGGSSVTLSTVNTYSGGTNVQAGTLIVGVSGALPADGAVSVGGSGSVGTVKLGQGIAAPTLSALIVNPGSVLDVAAGGIAIEFGSAGDPATAIRADLVSGYNAGGSKWTGTGINSSAAAMNPSGFSLGYADGSNSVDHANTGLPAGELEIKYTVAGDANLSGSVDLSDLVIIASDFGQSGADWAQGDLNYDGNVDLSDLVIVASNFGASLSSVQTADFSSSFQAEWQLALAEAHGADVSLPEPGVLLGSVAGAALVCRRARRSSSLSLRAEGKRRG